MINKATKPIRNERAGESEGTLAELLKYGSDKVDTMLANLFTTFINGADVPKS